MGKSLQKLKLRSTAGCAVGKDELENPKTQTALVINPSQTVGSVSVMRHRKKSLCSHECGTGICGAGVVTAWSQTDKKSKAGTEVEETVTLRAEVDVT